MPGIDYPAIAARYGSGGQAALNAEERLEIAGLFVREARKGAFQYDTFNPSATGRAFVSHVLKEFGPSADHKVVVDYTFMLLRSARSAATEVHPVVSVILYATWMEHWLNSVLVTKALKRGAHVTDAEQMVRDASLSAKLGWLWRLLELPTLEEGDLKKLRLLADVRNEFVHYKWKGKDPAVLEGPDQRLSAALADLEPVLRRVWDLASAHLDSPFLEHSRELFGADFGAVLADLWRYADG